MRHHQQTAFHDSHNGWKAALSLSFEPGPQRTVVRRKHTGPLTIQRPLYPENATAHVYMLHPPGGVVGGDELRVQVKTCTNAAGLVTTPGATKFYRSERVPSIVEQKLTMSGGSLEWFPQENIFFNECNAHVSTTIALSNDSAFAGWDIQCFGRVAGDQPFISGSVTNTLSLLIENKPVFHDRLLVNQEHPLSHGTTFRGCCVSGSLLINRMTEHCSERARHELQDDPDFFVTCFDSLLLVRYLGGSAQAAKHGFCKVWSHFRQQLNHQSAYVPRIWAT